MLRVSYWRTYGLSFVTLIYQRTGWVCSGIVPGISLHPIVTRLNNYIYDCVVHLVLVLLVKSIDRLHISRSSKTPGRNSRKVLVMTEPRWISHGGLPAQSRIANPNHALSGIYPPCPALPPQPGPPFRDSSSPVRVWMTSALAQTKRLQNQNLSFVPEK